MGESGHCMKLQGLYFAIVCEIEYSIMQKGLLTLFAPAYMGQFLQDGKNDQTLSKKIFFAASLWPNGLTFSTFLNCSEEILSAAS